jgi:glycine cleavage system transcriptional repressor
MRCFFVLSAIGRDRPGIVADVSELIYECGCNLEDSSMTLMGAHFALLVLLSGEKEEVSERLATGCKRLEWDKGLTVFLSPLDSREETFPLIPPEPDYELGVVGLDRAGIVYRTSTLLASKGINILDLHTRVEPAPESGSPIFTMTMKIATPAELDRRGLRSELDRLEDELNVEVSLSKRPGSR